MPANIWTGPILKSFPVVIRELRISNGVALRSLDTHLYSTSPFLTVHSPQHFSYIPSPVCKRIPFEGVICNPCIINLTLVTPSYIIRKDLPMVPWGRKKNSSFIFHSAVWANRWSIYRFPHFTPTKKTAVRLMSSSGAHCFVSPLYFFKITMVQSQTCSIIQLVEFKFCVSTLWTHVNYICIHFRASGQVGQ